MYLYLFENDKFRQSNELPTQADQECIKEGILAVFHYTKFCGYERLVFKNQDFVWEPVQEEKAIKNLGTNANFHA